MTDKKMSIKSIFSLWLLSSALVFLTSCIQLKQSKLDIPENYDPPSLMNSIKQSEKNSKAWKTDAELIGVHIPLASILLSDNSPGLIQFTFRSDSISDQAMNVLCLDQDCEPTLIENESEVCLVPISDTNNLMDSNQILETGIKLGGDIFLEEKGRVDLYLLHPCDSDQTLWRLVFLNIEGTDVLEQIINAENGKLIDSSFESVK